MRPPGPLQVGFAPRLAAFYAGLFVMDGIQLPFFPVWLKAKGLEPRMIGLVLAIPMIVRVFAIPLAAGTADRHDALRAVARMGQCGYGVRSLSSLAASSQGSPSISLRRGISSG